jgi:2-polyprenyl-6-methoxyphenol hydroxylase-like FAD-dependent oxidoreductase
VSFEQDDAGVTATLRGRDQTETDLRADFLVAADGHRSSIREALGIGRDGRGHILTGRSVLFRAPLERYLEAGIVQFEIEQPDFKAFLTTYKDGRWVLMGLSDEERD